MPHGGILQSDPQMIRSDSTRRAVPRTSREDVKLGRSPGWNPVRAERSRYCIYAYVNKATEDRGRKESDLRGNTCNLHSYTAKIASLPQTSEFSRSNAEGALDLKRGESRGYWKRHSPGKMFRQANISGRINHERAILLLVSILDTAFARKVGCNFDTSQKQVCVGIGDNVYTTEGRTKIKITLAGYLVYFFDIWIGDLSGQNAILGMDFMVPAGVRMDLADGSMRLPDEVGNHLMVRLYGEKVRSVILERSLRIPVGHAEEPDVRIILSATERLWVTRGERWIPTVTEGPGRTRYLVISNIGDRILRLDHRLDIGMILDQDKVPRSPGFVSVGSRRYREWQNLALESTDSPIRDEDAHLRHRLAHPGPLPLTTADAGDNLTESSHYASAAEDGSDTTSEPPRRMSLGPSGASMLEARSKIRRSSPARSNRRDNGSAPTDQATVAESSDRSKFFNAAMARYLAEEREANKDPASTRPQHQGSQDVAILRPRISLGI
ncbi:LOW QUALITY PROTEIN: hypothetical protein PHMEG_00032718 [Phytophthora megakarya]|uniref:Eukaryotic/viral aspartic protease n=1 Tax=Phytophthora megakarya TaxID=4795 RepID=A0A225UWK8_9STRA|nr:LOW QUALITY PROTEIN: hypothetical protein PHMEG_00032718 [Phytophthora megakarya]